MTPTWQARSDKGLVRETNEDAYLALPIDPSDPSSPVLMLVADGVGGRVHGEIASQTTVDTFDQLIKAGKLKSLDNTGLREPLLRMAVHKAHICILDYAQEQPQCSGMSCTLTLAYVDPDQITLAQVGDSRLYHFRAATSQLVQLSQDQTVATQLYQQGSIDKQAMASHPDRHTLTQSLGLEGIESPMEPVIDTFDWHPGDYLLICSDGLSDMVSDQDIEAVIQGQNDLSSAADQLLQAALDGGGKDNVTFILARNADL